MRQDDAGGACYTYEKLRKKCVNLCTVIPIIIVQTFFICPGWGANPGPFGCLDSYSGSSSILD
jgi:hypothetical protein